MKRLLRAQERSNDVVIAALLLNNKISEAINSSSSETEAAIRLAKIHEILSPLADALAELAENLSACLEDTNDLFRESGLIERQQDD